MRPTPYLRLLTFGRDSLILLLLIYTVFAASAGYVMGECGSLLASVPETSSTEVRDLLIPGVIEELWKPGPLEAGASSIIGDVARAKHASFRDAVAGPGLYELRQLIASCRVKALDTLVLEFLLAYTLVATIYFRFIVEAPQHVVHYSRLKLFLLVLLELVFLALPFMAVVVFLSILELGPLPASYSKLVQSLVYLFVPLFSILGLLLLVFFATLSPYNVLVIAVLAVSSEAVIDRLFLLKMLEHAYKGFIGAEVGGSFEAALITSITASLYMVSYLVFSARDLSEW